MCLMLFLSQYTLFLTASKCLPAFVLAISSQCAMNQHIFCLNCVLPQLKNELEH